MAKQSKLTEKPTRMPDIDSAKDELAIRTYLNQIEGINSEPAKSQRFTLLLQALFGVQPGFIENYVQGIEKYLKVREKDRILRGRADQLSGNLIIEFEKDLTTGGKLDEAERQLKQYTACVWSQEAPGKRTNFVCLAADGRRFRAYVPLVRDISKQAVAPESVELALLEKLDARNVNVRPSEFYFFLDRYLLRKEILHPTSEHIVKDFGPNSHVFQVAGASLLQQWSGVKDHSDYCVLYEAWGKYLRIVYGSSLGDHELFARHTYLATLAKLMVWARLASRQNHPGERDILGILEGTYFKEELGIENFMEEDFFSWVARKEAKKTGVAIAQMLLELLRNYNLREISEDVLKALYEGLVDPATRHDLGEYYTPDWLADRIVRTMLKPDARATILDSACGSGTFLYMAIREKRRRLGNSAATLKHVLLGVVGMDIHPLACIVAKANYVLALGALMQKRKQRIAIPVYLANSIRPPERAVQRELWHKVDCYFTEIDGNEVHIPAELIEDPGKYDQAIEAARDFAIHSKGKKPDVASFRNFLKANHPRLVDDEDAANVLFFVAETLRKMIENRRDTIWAYVLKNMYKPLFLKEAFDIVVGNPPWLSYRYVERSDYQAFLKHQITKKYELVTGRAELVTHLELGTLFLARSVDLYLKFRGNVAFVLPKSIFSADQHDALRRGTVKKVLLSPTSLWDLEHVSPLFNISSAVYFGQKKWKPHTEKPIPGEILSGELPVRNAGLDRAEKNLACQTVKWYFSTRGKGSFWNVGKKVVSKESPYRKRFCQGASIVPRCLWFVDVGTGELGFDAALPPLVSSKRSQEKAKPQYRDCVLQGNVEAKFVYRTLLDSDLVPFGQISLRPVVLPIESKGGELRLYDTDVARKTGYVHLAAWITKAQNEWESRRGTKADKMTCLDRINYQHLLTKQNPQAKFRVVYATSGTNVCACVVDMDTSGLTDGIRASGVVADYTTYHLESPTRDEAHYLASVLNAPCVNEAIKAAQARGLWGARHVCKKVLDLPIPYFNEATGTHVRLSKLGRACADAVVRWIARDGPGKTKSTGKMRGKVRELLSKELAQIDSIVKPMLGL